MKQKGNSIMKYNPAVRKNILLQEMTAFTANETEALLSAVANVEELSDRASTEVETALVNLLKTFVYDDIARANQARDLLNTFFDETGDLDEERYLLFKPIVLVDEEAEAVEDTSTTDDGMEEEFVYQASVEEDSVEEDLPSEAVEALSAEDQEVYDSLPEDDGVDPSVDGEALADVFGETGEEFNSRQQAEKLSASLDMPDTWGL